MPNVRRLPLPNGPADGIDGNGPLTQICNAYAEVCLAGGSITKNNPQPSVNLQTNLLDPSRKIKRDDHRSAGPETGKPCPNHHPDLDFLIERHFGCLPDYSKSAQCLFLPRS